MKMLRFLRNYPTVWVTLLVGAAVLVLILAGQEPLARLLASAYIGVIILITGWGMVRDIMRGHWGLDILALVAMIATVLVGEYVAGLIIVLMISGGQALEDYAEAKARGELSALLARAPDRAHRVLGGDARGEGGRIEEITAEEVAVGDTLLVRPSELVPVDGELLGGTASFDESSLTGEPLPVTRVAGERVMSGSVNGQGAVYVRALARSADSQYQQIVMLVREAEEAKAPAVRVADRFAVPFTVFSLLVAGLAWLISGEPRRFAEVLVLATPCPLLIAAPVAFLGGMSRAAKSGIIVKGGAALEQLARARSAAFDKTGTLTAGRPELRALRPAFGPGTAGLAEDELLALAASAEQYSSHVLAAGVLAAARARGLQILPGQEAEEIATHGVVATVDGRRVVVGKLSFIREEAPEARPSDAASGHVGIFVAVDGRFAGEIVMGDTVRPEAAETIAQLREGGIEQIVMLTGDARSTAERVAAETGITEVHAELLPEDKVRLIAQLRPLPSLMVGDGVNDAPVLAAAGAGIAMGARGSTAASESADVVILADSIAKVAEAQRIGTHTLAVAMQAIWIGIALSVVLMLIAAFGFIPAVVGALTQEFVDLAAILYALRALSGPSGRRRLAAPRVRA